MSYIPTVAATVSHVYLVYARLSVHKGAEKVGLDKYVK